MMGVPPSWISLIVFHKYNFTIKKKNKMGTINRDDSPLE